MNIQNLLNKAEAHLLAKRHTQAIEICRKILRRDKSCLHALFIMGKCHVAQEKFRAATEYFRDILKYDPTRTQVLLEIGNALRMDGETDEAIRYLEEALVHHQSHQHHLELGLALLEKNALDEARASFLRALDFAPRCHMSIKKLGIIARDTGDLEEAERRFRQLIDIDPAYPFAYKDLIRFHLMNRNPEAALAVCNECLDVDPKYSRTYSLKHVALSELDDRNGCSYLFDTDNLIRRIKVEPPEQFGDTEQFNRRLVNHIMKSPLLKNSKSYATRNGWHSESNRLFESNPKLGQTVHGMIRTAIDRYIEQLPVDPEHPINISRPAGISLNAWAVVMEHQGHQKEHIHPNGWLTGVYYVQLPEDFDRQEDEYAGHIVFGKSHDELHQLHPPETVTLKPHEGEFVVFPSYFWHHTVPLQSHQRRICIAFDLQPAKERS